MRFSNTLPRLILTIRLLRSVLAKRGARAHAGWTPPAA
ncbi:hypothetical protein M2316_002403 [Cellulosimicrobium cellulans]|nr:hypothetical protein [Cellulosimicrobium cellulans]